MSRIGKQPVAIPGGNRRVHLDRIVVFARDDVALIDLDLGRNERAFRNTTARLGRPTVELADPAVGESRGHGAPHGCRGRRPE